jgi:hypothetical protein
MPGECPKIHLKWPTTLHGLGTNPVHAKLKFRRPNPAEPESNRSSIIMPEMGLLLEA